jgi:hypothetical protein
MVVGPFKRPRQFWVARGGGGGFFEAFFRAIARADQVKALNSFKFDVLGDIKALALNSMKKGISDS